MKIREIKNKRSLLVVVQGVVLLAVLSLLFSILVYLVAPVMMDIGIFLDKAASSVSEEARPAAADAGTGDARSLPESPNPAAYPVPPDPEYIGSDGVAVPASFSVLIAVMYALFALYFLLTAVSSRDQWKANPKRYGLVALCFSACAVIFLTGNSDRAYVAASCLHVLAFVLDHIFAIVRDHRIRKVIPRVVFILFLLFDLMMLVVSGRTALVYVLLMTIPRVFCYILRIAFSRVKADVLKKILRKTYAAEILFGLLLLVIAFSIVLPQFEEGIPTFPDALWYCFAIVTTIGFGDFTAVSLPGRILSVILGIYGIIVVALITSIIVNFYTETKGDPLPEEAGQPGGTDAG